MASSRRSSPPSRRFDRRRGPTPAGGRPFPRPAPTPAALGEESLRRRYRRISCEWAQARWDPASALVCESAGGPGLPGATLAYARILLDARTADDVERARAAVTAALATQVLRDGSPEDGTFPRRVAETGVEAGGDPAQARSNAQVLVELLHWHGERLGAPVVSAMEAALERCARLDLRGHPSPERTSDALLSAAVLACAGDWLRDRRCATAGRNRLAGVLERHRRTGAFAEYNAPAGAGFALRALASALAFCRDEETQARATALWRGAWTGILDRLHPPSGQLAGPHAGAGGRDLLASSGGVVKYYVHRALGGGFPLGRVEPPDAEPMFPGLMVQDPDCPPDLIAGWKATPLPRTVRSIADSRAAGEPVAGTGDEDGTRLAERMGTPMEPGFRGQAQRITTHLTAGYALGTASAEAQGDGTAALLAHWPGGPSAAPGSYLAALALEESAGRLTYLRSGVLCLAQREGRVLGLLRFGLDPQTLAAPLASVGCLGFQVSASADPEIVALGRPRPGGAGLNQGVIVRTEGLVAGLRVLKARIPGARIDEVVRDLPAPAAPPEGEVGIHLRFTGLALEEGQVAYVAFALEVCDDGNVSALSGRLRGARVVSEPDRSGRLRLAWGADLVLETSARVLPPRAWLTAEGAVRTGR